MGAGASAQEGESAAIFDQLMAKWETLALEPQYSGTGDVTKPANYEELVNMGIPAAGPEQEFFLELRKHFRSIVKADVGVMEFSFNDNAPAEKKNLQEAFKNRPITSKKRPNKLRQQMKAKARAGGEAPYVA